MMGDVTNVAKFPIERWSMDPLKRVSADRHGFLEAVEHESLTTLHDVIRLPLVFWSMWACLWDDVLKNVTLPTDDVLAFFKANLGRLLSLRDQHRQQHGMNPCPKVLVRMLL